MAEQVYKSAGVFTREIDTSQPSAQGISGVPAGIVGTANLGPAFVPIVFGNLAAFVQQYGEIDGSSFGRIAAQEYLSRGGDAVAYVRILGIGDGKQRNTDGSVTNAGFVVGNKLVQANGDLGANPFANSGAGGDIGGRTYFLGCFMSESNGSTIFSDAGIQRTGAHKAASVKLTYDGSPDDGNTITLISSKGVSKTYEADSGGASNGEIINTDKVAFVLNGGSPDTTYQNLIAAINHANGHNGGVANSVFKITDGTSGGSGTTGTVTLEQVVPGASGNTTVTENVSGLDVAGVSPTTVNKFTGGVDGSHAVPILRGVLLAPSGVVLSLSSSTDKGKSQKPLKTTTATDNTDVNGRYGQLTGSVVMANPGQFSLLLNGYKGSQPNVVTASFDPTSKSYIGDSLNRDPFKIEEYGHYLYSDYPVYPTFAVITGSGVIAPSANAQFEDIAFLLTGSNAKGITSGFGSIPDYEDFQDRFTHAESPFIISQDLGVKYNLFKLIALSPGEDFAKKYKFSIFNLNKSQKTFSLSIRERSDTDNDPRSVAGETYNGLSLDPNNDNYIARVIGDLNIKYDFDTASSAQKIIVEGTHPNQSKLVRVKVSTDLERKNVPAEALPFGFRGLMHTVTSGSLLSGRTMTEYDINDILNRVIETPVPFRENISDGTGRNKLVSSNYHWGIQTEFKTVVADPNFIDNTLQNIPDATLSHVIHYPTHRSNTTAFAVRDNEGVADVNGSVLDADKFNKNIFSLEHVRVRTGSAQDGTITTANPDQWVSASFVRGGNISADTTNKTRGFLPSDLDVQANTKYAKFTCLFQGGFNGSNIFDQDKYELTNNAVKREYDYPTTQGGVNSGPTINAYRKALDVLGSKSDIDIQLLVTPGIRNSSVTDYAISVAENRFDCLYIMDLEERDSDNIVITGSGETPSITYTIRGHLNRSLDSSFAASYFPDVNSSVSLSDGSSITKRLPPSAAVLGAYANNDTIGQSWFAPAGASRGTLPSVTSTALGVLTRDSMDELYQADINPIQTDVGLGITIQGQKTLLKSLSALDRVNVRRLLINIRRAVRDISNSLIFEPNRKETLDKFRSRVNPVLEAIKNQGGVSRYKVVIDNTTTTQADIENNTIRGKIYIQPVRVAEFIALDFNITNQIID